jgi:hypothetical protein
VKDLRLTPSDVQFLRQIDPNLSENALYYYELAGRGLGLEGREFTDWVGQLYTTPGVTPKQVQDTVDSALQQFEAATPSSHYATQEEYEQARAEAVAEALREAYPQVTP